MDNEFDYEMERKLLHEKNQHLSHAHERIHSIRDIVNETSSMVDEQGEKLDIIGDELFDSYKNIGLTNQNLSQAN